jgi:SOS-response transcriptional repressor LexA
MRQCVMTRYGVPALTARQQLVLTAVADFVRDAGRPPTLRELAEAIGINSTNGATDHLKALERKGYLERGDYQARALVVLRDVDGRPLVSHEEEVAALKARVAELEQQLAEATRATRAA